MIASIQNAFATLFWFLVVVGILVFVHEAGHFVTAKLFGIRVDVFSLGFGKRVLGRRRGETDYRVSLIPLGGYVKLTGGEEAGEVTGPIPPDYFLARPRWQRFLVLVMGATVNIALAVALYTASFMIGFEMPGPILPIVQEVEPGSAAAAAGLQAGDRIIRMNGAEVKAWNDIQGALVRGGSRLVRLEVSRAGRTLELGLTPTFDRSGVPSLGARLAEPVMVVQVSPRMPAAKAGIQPNDMIQAIDGKPVLNREDATRVIYESAGRELTFTIRRGDALLDLKIAPVERTMEGRKVGLIGVNLTPVEVVKLGAVPAFRRAVATCWDLAGSLFHVLKNLVTRNQPFSTLSGPIEIAKVSKTLAERGFQFLVVWMGFISLQLGILNLLPIPVLDGGHVFILLTEGVLRRDLSIRVKERLNKAGFIALVALMAAVIFQDILKNI